MVVVGGGGGVSSYEKENPGPNFARKILESGFVNVDLKGWIASDM